MGRISPPYGRPEPRPMEVTYKFKKEGETLSGYL
jgi:hypothetical protein